MLVVDVWGAKWGWETCTQCERNAETGCGGNTWPDALEGVRGLCRAVARLVMAKRKHDCLKICLLQLERSESPEEGIQYFTCRT